MKMPGARPGIPFYQREPKLTDDLFIIPTSNLRVEILPSTLRLRASAHIRIVPTMEERIWFRALLDRAHGKAGYETSDEEIIDDGNWHARDQAGRHHRVPEIDIAPHKKGRHADTHRIARRRGDECDAIDKFLRHQSKGEDHRSQYPGARNRHHHLDEGAKAAQPVDHGRVLQITRDRLAETHQKPGAKRHREARIDEEERPHRILQPECRDDARDWDEQNRRRNKRTEE